MFTNLREKMTACICGHLAQQNNSALVQHMDAMLKQMPLPISHNPGIGDYLIPLVLWHLSTLRAQLIREIEAVVTCYGGVRDDLIHGVYFAFVVRKLMLDFEYEDTLRSAELAVREFFPDVKSGLGFVVSDSRFEGAISGLRFYRHEFAGNARMPVVDEFVRAAAGRVLAVRPV